MNSQINSNSKELPLLTFNSLYIILRGEKNNSKLELLPENFYEAMTLFFENKKNEITRLTNANEKEKLLKEKRIFTSSKKIATELFQLRLIKISSSAIKSSIFSDDDYKDENLTSYEESFFNDIHNSTNKLKKVIL